VFVTNSASSFERSQRARRSHDRQLTTMAIDFQVGAELRDLLEHGSIDLHSSQTRSRTRDPFAQLFLIFCERLTEPVTVLVVSVATLDDVNAILQVVFRFYFGVKTKTI
jgi:hypothetical protein